MSYWKKRQSSTLEEILKNADVSSDEIANLYVKSSIYLNDKIQGIFNKYRSKYGLSVQEAENLLNQLDDPTSYDEMLQRLKNSEGEEKQELLKELESPAYRYRINRLQEVQKSMDDVMQNIYHQEKTINTDSYIKTAHDAYYKTMFNIQKDIGVEFDFSSLNPKHIDMLLHANWSGQNYSQRIWNNTQDLSSQIKEELLMGILTGKTEREMQQDITEKFQVANYKARRLVQTESAYMSTMMDLEAYKEADIDTVRFVAIHDLKTSKICQQHDGKYVKIKDAVVGSNVPPLHPNCRSDIEPVIDEELDRNMKRRVKDENGHYQMVDANETYEQWYERTQGKKLDKSGWKDNLEKGITTKKDMNMQAKVNLDYINSKDYRLKFNKISNNQILNQEIYSKAKAILIHRNKTNLEDIYLIDSNTGKTVASCTSSKVPYEVSYSLKMKKVIEESDNYTLISIHNHGSNIPPTGSDFVSCGQKKYKYGIVVCHNGTIYIYKNGEKPFTSGLLNKRIEKYKQKVYNLSEKEAHIKALKEFEKEYGIEWREL